jgi:geranylgeranyl pyrophosphate synthase
LIAACCKGGAIVSHATEEEIALLYEYGLNLGIAFQIIDDVLDYTEDQATIGKPAGNDLRQGMVTSPLIYALQEQPQNGLHQQVHRLLNGTSHKDEDILSVVNWVIRGPGVARSLADAHVYANKAREALYHFPASHNRDVLDELIDFVVSRKH